jgi:hypothetical protein
MMAYVEFLRARRVLLWYFGIFIGLFLLGLIASLFGNNGHIVIDMSSDSASHSAPVNVAGTVNAALPISLLEYAATFGAMLVAVILGSSLNRQHEHLPLVWTRPLARERFALDSLAVDASAILVTLLGTLLLFWIAAATSKPHPLQWYGDSVAFPAFVFGFGAALMVYALSQAVTSWYLGSGGLIKGLVGAGCGTLVGVGAGHLASPYGAIVGALNYLNPLAYFVPIAVNDKHAPIVLNFIPYLPLDLAVKIACVWLLAAVYMAIATYGWKRLEL